ncbi:MAG TPA: twin transmembrane helix small protein [Burkholderiales bacterium]|nr:twin transmembrane helix small protein [Burkholderiales bacterium]
MRLVVFIFLAFILFSLFSGLYYVWKDKGRSDRAVKALTVRVILSIVLFLMLVIGFQLGLFHHKL